MRNSLFLSYGETRADSFKPNQDNGTDKILTIKVLRFQSSEGSVGRETSKIGG